MDSNEKRTDLLRQLGEEAEKLRTTQGWAEWLRVAGRFHDYSLNNQLLILGQRPDATRVAGYRTWQSLGRQVQRGEKALRIFAPSFRREADERTGDERRVLSGFRLVSVFDMSQTTGDQLPTLTMPPVRDCDAHLHGALIAFAHGRGIDVESVPTSPNDARGSWSTEKRTATIVEGHDQASRTRTLLHELAHALDSEDAATWAYSSREEKELVAESACYLAGCALGVGLSDASTFYVASWGADPDKLTALAERVLAVARPLIAFGQPGEEAVA